MRISIWTTTGFATNGEVLRHFKSALAATASAIYLDGRDHGRIDVQINTHVSDQKVDQFVTDKGEFEEVKSSTLVLEAIHVEPLVSKFMSFFGNLFPGLRRSDPRDQLFADAALALMWTYKVGDFTNPNVWVRRYAGRKTGWAEGPANDQIKGHIRTRVEAFQTGSLLATDFCSHIRSLRKLGEREMRT